MNVTLDAIYGCELWQGRLDKDGYGLMPNGRRAHIVAWEREHGPIAADMALDHLCRRRACCCLAHLEPVTKSENELRKSWKRRVRRMTCPRGHSMHDAKVTPEGGRICRACSRGEA